jgi:cyanophycin synthetase
MDDKAEMARRFAEKNIPTARGGKVKTWLAALALFSSLKKPIIVKPVSGSRGRHTTLHINKEEELRRGLDIARQLSPWVVVQEELTGPVYRVTVIGGKLQAVLRRDPAGVIGDGIHSIRALAETENKNPLRQGPLFHHLPLDLGAEEELSRQNFTWESIPAMGLFVALGTKTSRGMGGALVDVTDVVHPDNNALFEKIGSVLVDPLVGIDFIIMDIKKSWKVQDQCGVIECNSLPFIDLHHFPLQGQPRNVAGAVWELVFCDF